jgi:hypothetical protein
MPVMAISRYAAALGPYMYNMATGSYSILTKRIFGMASSPLMQIFLPFREHLDLDGNFS